MNPHRDPGATAVRIEELEAENARLAELLKFRPKTPSRLVRFATEYRNTLEPLGSWIVIAVTASVLAVFLKLTYKLVVWL